jgi:hypothetical protein
MRPRLGKRFPALWQRQDLCRKAVVLMEPFSSVPACKDPRLAQAASGEL